MLFVDNNTPSIIKDKRQNIFLIYCGCEMLLVPTLYVYNEYFYFDIQCIRMMLNQIIAV
jgi:hypothetical protein